MCNLLRVKQDISVLIAGNDPKPQKVDVMRVILNRELTPIEVLMAQQQQGHQSASVAAQQRAAAALGGIFYGGLGAQQQAYTPGMGLVSPLGGFY